MNFDLVHIVEDQGERLFRVSSYLLYAVTKKGDIIYYLNVYDCRYCRTVQVNITIHYHVSDVL